MSPKFLSTWVISKYTDFIITLYILLARIIHIYALNIHSKTNEQVHPASTLCKDTVEAELTDSGSTTTLLQ